MKRPNLYRQGDVLVIPIDAATAKIGKEIPRDDGRIVLAYGEVTGHAHAISSTACFLYQDDGIVSAPDVKEAISRLGGGLIADRILRATEPVRLLHEEHAPIDLPAGSYRVRIQREYSPSKLRNVAD